MAKTILETYILSYFIKKVHLFDVDYFSRTFDLESPVHGFMSAVLPTSLVPSWSHKIGFTLGLFLPLSLTGLAECHYSRQLQGTVDSYRGGVKRVGVPSIQLP